MFTLRVLSGILLCVASACGLKGQTVSFLPPVDAVLSGFSPGSGTCGACLAVADFNGDGKPDIAYAYNDTIPFTGVALGNGDGSFRGGPNNQAPSIFGYDEVTGLFAGDFNGDGKMDLAIAEAIALGNGDGTFQAPVNVAGCTAVVAAIDVNRDGKADLVCVNSILLSNGDGTFRAGATMDANQGDTVLLTADFNHDGKPDLLLQQLSGQLAVALGNGDGTFGADLPIGASMFTEPIAGDFNGDGKLDLVGLCTRAGLICFLPGAGDGTFGNAVTTEVPGTLPGSFSGAADFNGDGKLDLLVGNAILRGNGDGTFQPPIFVGAVAALCGAEVDPSLADLILCASTNAEAVVADFNGDGLPDVLESSVVQDLNGKSDVEISVLLNDRPGDGFLTAGLSSATLGWQVAPRSIASAFGVNLAPSTAAVASDAALPTTLGGIRVHVRDRGTGDHLAPLYYVSPTQINYLMVSSDPNPWIGIERVGTTYVPEGMAVSVSPVAAGFYTVPTAGPTLGNPFVVTVDLAAASALSIGAGGMETAVPVLSCGSTGCSAVPINVSGNPVYLSIYGTGFAAATAAASTCTIGSETLPVSYAGPEIQEQGLDQLNLLLPKSMAGGGAVAITCTIGDGNGDTSVTNTVGVTIQ